MAGKEQSKAKAPQAQPQGAAMGGPAQDFGSNAAMQEQLAAQGKTRPIVTIMPTTFDDLGPDGEPVTYDESNVIVAARAEKGDKVEFDVGYTTVTGSVVEAYASGRCNVRTYFWSAEGATEALVYGGVKWSRGAEKAARAARRDESDDALDRRKTGDKEQW